MSMTISPEPLNQMELEQALVDLYDLLRRADGAGANFLELISTACAGRYEIRNRHPDDPDFAWITEATLQQLEQQEFIQVDVTGHVLVTAAGLARGAELTTEIEGDDA